MNIQLRFPEFKNAGAWEEKTLGEVCEVNYGTRVVRKRDGGTMYPVYGGGGKTFFVDMFNRENNLIVSRFAMSEKCTRFVRGKFFLNDSGLTIKSKGQELDQNFLDLQIFLLNDLIYSIGRGVAQRNLDVAKLKQIKISIPPLEEQKKIADCLSSLDNLIAAQTKKIEKLKALKKGLLQQLFPQTG